MRKGGVFVGLRRKPIDTFMARNNIAQEDFGRMINSSGCYVTQMLSGNRNPGPALRRNIMKVVKNHTWDQLFYIVEVK